MFSITCSKICSRYHSLIVKKLDQLGVTYAYRTILDKHQKVEDGRSDLERWLDDEETKKQVARCSETDPYVDPFGEDVTRYLE